MCSTTKENYYRIWKIFSDFYLKLDEKPIEWEDRITLFVGHLIQRNIKSTTINSYISALKNVLQSDNVKLNKDRSLLMSLTKACKLKNDTLVTRLPIHRELLVSLNKAICHLFDQQPYLSSLYRAMFNCSYFGLLRIGEVAESMHAIKAKDVFVGTNKPKLMLILRSSKIHWVSDKPQIIKLSKENRRTTT